MKPVLTKIYNLTPGTNLMDSVNRLKNPMRRNPILGEMRVKLATTKSLSDVCDIALHYSQKL